MGASTAAGACRCGEASSERGKQRAAAFVNYFKNNPAVNRHGPLVAIYAMGQHGEDGSLRPIQTVTPLATSLGLSIITRFMKKDVYALARDILAGGSYADKTVLICWEHKMIPEIVKALGYAEPPPFPNVYDRTWLLTFKNGKPLSLQILPQALLPGDDGI